MSKIGIIVEKFKQDVKPLIQRVQEKAQARRPVLERTYQDVVQITGHKTSPDILVESTGGINIYTRHNSNAAKTTINPVVALLPKPFIEWLLSHELKHQEQFNTVARRFAGDPGVTIEQGLENFKKFLGNPLDFNEKHYKKVIETEGIIHSDDSADNKRAFELINAMVAYVNPSSVEDVFKSIGETFNMKKGESFTDVKNRMKKLIEFVKQTLKNNKLYKNNPIEVEARQASRDFAKAKVKQKVKKALGIE